VAALRVDGHDVLFVGESAPGSTDDEVLRQASSEGRILLTEDKDFGELVYRLKRPAPGIIFLRFDVVDRALKIPRLRSLLENQPNQIPDAFVVIDKEKIRFRPLRE
jgi:predicted nuclease of predicted toxin-antitoxin system